MKNKFSLLILLFLTFSCSTVIYYPNSHATPLFREKNESVFSADIRGMGGDFHAAYAPAKHFAMMANANIMQFTSMELENDYKNGQAYGELAPGYYKVLGSAFVIESYVGAGIGRSYSENLQSGVLRTSDYFKAFLQMNAGFRWKYLTLGLSARESFVHAAAPHYNVHYADNEIPQSDIFFEPMLFMGIGPEKFRINAKAGMSLSHFMNISNSPFLLSLGLETRFSGKK